jgi:hypothetical protein
MERGAEPKPAIVRKEWTNMSSRTVKQSLVWGGLLIVIGVLLAIDQLTELSPWVWVLALGAFGLVALVLYLADRSDWAMLITAYALLAITLLIALSLLDIVSDEVIGSYILVAISLAFLAVYFRNRARWWALIPAYVLLAIGIMIGLVELGLLDDLLVPAYVLLAIAIPFFVVFARDRRQWWALIPGGILAVIGLSFLVAEGSFAYIGAFLLILGGLWILVRSVVRREPPAPADGPVPDQPEASSPDTEGPGEEGTGGDGGSV